MAENFRAKKLLITGGAGFLGSHLCERLIAAGHDVLCVDNFFTGGKANVEHLLKHPHFELMRHDVMFPLYVEVEEIYNLACPASPVHYQFDPVQTTKTSVHGAINMLGLAKRVKAKILQASTSEVYGDPEIHPQSEDYWGRVNPVGMRSCYDEGKRCAETLFFDYWRQHSVRIKVAADLQHLWSTHASARWASHLELHRAGARGRGHHCLRRRAADPELLLCRRSGRGLDPADGYGRRFHRADQPRQPAGIHDSGAGPAGGEVDGHEEQDRV